MPLLQVRDFPQDLYNLLKYKAAAEHRSIAQQTTVIIKDALEKDLAAAKERRLRALERTRMRNKLHPVPEEVKNFDIVKWIRESREDRYYVKQIEKDIEKRKNEKKKEVIIDDSST